MSILLIITPLRHLEKKTKWELHQNVESCFKQIQEAAPYKTDGCPVYNAKQYLVVKLLELKEV